MKKIYGTLLVFIVSLIYLSALAPTVSFRDSGDMVSAAFVLGISHPSGFPLYMLLGKLFSFIPFGEAGSRMALLSLLSASFACFFVYLSVKTLTSDRLPGLLSAVFLAFALTFWSYAEIGEKYSLYALFASILLYLAVIGRIYLYAFFFGLGLTHHLALIVFGLPSIYLLWITSRKKTILRTAGISLLCFSAPLVLYLYLPLRAVAGTPLSWGSPDTLEKFINHITAREYRYAMFTGEPLSFPAKLYAQAVLNFIREFTLAGYITGLCGGVYLFMKNRKAAIFLFLALLSNISIFVNYNILDQQNIGTYYFASFVIFSILIGCGAWTLNGKSLKKSGYLKAAVLLALFAVCLNLLGLNYGKTDRSSDWKYRDYGYNLLKSIEPGSMLFTNGDIPLFSLWYNQYVNGHDKKIDIMTLRSIDVEKTIEKNYPLQKIYFNAFPYESLGWKNYFAVPEGIVYRIYKKNRQEIKIDLKALLKKWEGYSIRGVYGAGDKKDLIISKLYAESHLMQGEFFADNGFYSEALEQFEKTLRIFPDYIMAYLNVGLLAEQAGNTIAARSFYLNALKAMKNDSDGGELKQLRRQLREIL
ncbi:MAG: DUF2723 domain-containing protein, partial [Candidatus Firestonebacteria bacterium]